MQEPAACVVAFLPGMFYLLKFGKFSLLAGNGLSLDTTVPMKMLELMFDPNIGLIMYVPLTIALFLIMLVRSRDRFGTERQLLVVLLAIMFVVALKVHWNHGTSGPSRYGVWILPIIIFIVVRNSDRIIDACHAARRRSAVSCRRDATYHFHRPS